MWISKNKYAKEMQAILKERRQEDRLSDMLEAIWELEDNARELKDRITKLENKSK